MGRPKLGNRIEINDDVATIFMKRKDGTVLKTIIDADDVLLASQYTWYGSWNENNKSFYARAFAFINGKKTSIRLNRLIMNAPAEMQVDHFNHDTLDNRKQNLRLSTPSENSQNLSGARRHSKSGIRDVFWNKNLKKWTVQVRIHGKLIHVGYFKDINIAEKAAIEARTKYLPYSQEATLEVEVNGIR